MASKPWPVRYPKTKIRALVPAYTDGLIAAYRTAAQSERAHNGAARLSVHAADED